MIKLVLMIVVLYLLGRYLLPHDWARIKNIWLHGVLYSSVPCLLFAEEIFASLRRSEIITAISIGLLISLSLSYLIYRYEKKLLSEHFFIKIKPLQLIIWFGLFIIVKVLNMSDSVMFLAIVVYAVASLLGTVFLESYFKKEIRIRLKETNERVE